MTSFRKSDPGPDQADLAQDQSIHKLSPRQREILQLVAQGKTNREIAQLFKRSESTVLNHVHAILRRLGVANRTEATVRWMQFEANDL